MTAHRLPAISLQRAVLGTIVLALIAGFVPAALVLDSRLASTLETRARRDLSLAPRILVDRQASSSDAMMMHAKDFAHVQELADAVADGRQDEAQRIANRGRAALGGEPVIIGPDGAKWMGDVQAPLLETLVTETRHGRMPVATVRDSASLRDVSLAPLEHDGRWVGAAGLTIALDAAQAATLAGLTRTDVLVLSHAATTPVVSDRTPERDEVTASTLDSTLTRALVSQWHVRPTVRATAPTDSVTTGVGANPRGELSSSVHDVSVAGRHFIVVAAPWRNAGTVLLVRDLEVELSVLPLLRRMALLSVSAALLAALLTGVWLSSRIARPVIAVARAADAIAAGDIDMPASSAERAARSFTLLETARVETAFVAMRAALADRLRALGDANQALADRNARLTTLQADLVQRERQAATGRLVVQLAHEIRNPVASLRNCLELIRRRVAHDEEAREFADLAVDELLRMHELAEQMLDLNRPRTQLPMRCDALVVARQVVALLMTGAPADAATVVCTPADASTIVPTVAMAPDVLKQILLNLTQNAREALAGRVDGAVTINVARVNAHVVVTVADNGPGIAPDILPRIFDPFFTTKREMRGVGLGLFIADGLVRAAGGTLHVRATPKGSAFSVHLETDVETVSTPAVDSSTLVELVRT